MKTLSNKEIAYILYEIATFYTMKDVPFKPMAYERAAGAVDTLKESLKDVYTKHGKKGLTEIDGIGPGIAEHIEELLEKGHFEEYDKLRKEFPIHVRELTEVEGIGAHTVKKLWEHLKIKDVDDLEKAAKEGRIRNIPGLGKKTEEKILQGIAFLKSSGGRKLLGVVLPETRALEEKIKNIPWVEEVFTAGSVRRLKETVGDIDCIVTAKKGGTGITDAFAAFPEVAHVYGKGKTKANVRLKSGLDADLRVVPKRALGAALHYFTGSKAHNIALRELAQKRGWKLNEYGLFKRQETGDLPTPRLRQAGKGKEKKWDFIGGKTEEELYKKLGLSYIEPELREMTGEIEAAGEGKLPTLVGFGDLKGDLQVQTDWTDGEDSVEEMAHAAEKLGLSYIVITDHTKSLAMTGGADEKKLLRQMEEIDALNAPFHVSGFRFQVLKGAEVNIKKDGTLDIDDETLEKLDCVGAAVHSHFTLSQKEQTARVVAAMENPHVDIIFHLTGRLINKRRPIELDIEKIIAAAKRTGTVLEIDAFPDRLDISDDYIRMCVNTGVKMSINSDAHAQEHFALLAYGIGQARRGWAEKKDIINTLSAHELLKELKKPKGERWKE